MDDQSQVVENKEESVDSEADTQKDTHTTPKVIGRLAPITWTQLQFWDVAVMR